MDLISTIIPTYNGERFLAQALQSIEQQNDPNLEVILVDDGSSDRTIDVAYSFEKRIPLKIEKVAHTGSWTANSNYGASLSNGRFLGFLHQDDYWLPERLKGIRQVIEQNSDIQVFLHPSRYVTTSSKNLCVINCPLSKSGPIDSKELFEKLYVQNFIMMPAPLIERSKFLEVGGFDTDYWYTADWKLWLSLTKTAKWYYIKEPLSSFRLHSSSQTINSSSATDDFREQHVKILDHFSSAGEIISTAPPARCSAELNIALASIFHHRSFNYSPLLKSMKKLRLKSTWQLFSYARLHERIGARMLCGLYQSREADNS